MGVQVKTLSAAPRDSQKPKTGDILLCHYTGWLKTPLGTKGTQFDSSRGGFGPFQKPPFKFALGRNRVIKAWDVGIAKMRVGEKALLTCSSDVCYGRDGAGPIPPDSDLIFEVELLGIDGYQPNIFEQQRRGGAPKMRLDAMDVGFVSVVIAILGSIGLLLKSLASDSARAVDGGIGARGLTFGGPTRVEESNPIIDKIVQARSTSAPGFVFEVVEEGMEVEDEVDVRQMAAEAMADTADVDDGAALMAAAQAAARAQDARAEVQRRLEAAVEREDYAAAAALKEELDGMA